MSQCYMTECIDYLLVAEQLLLKNKKRTMVLPSLSETSPALPFYQSTN